MGSHCLSLLLVRQGQKISKMSTIVKPDGSRIQLPEDQKWRVEKMFALVSEVFHTKATNGKIPNADAMKAYYALQDKYVEVGINNKEEVEDLKKFAGDLEVVVKACDANNDGFIDLEEFKNLYREAWSAYIGALFKTYDLNKDGLITQDEMNAVVAGIDRPIRAKRVRQCFDVMLANFDVDGDGKLSLFEFSEAMKTLQF